MQYKKKKRKWTIYHNRLQSYYSSLSLLNCLGFTSFDLTLVKQGDHCSNLLLQPSMQIGFVGDK